MKPDSMRKKCQAIWLKAASGEDVTLNFANKTDRERAKFTLYDACRNTTDPAILEAKALVEVRKGKPCSLIISLKSKNQYHQNLEKELESAIGAENLNGDQLSPEESLKRFLEKLEEGGEDRPATPYFDRKED
jgi:hypothetical protein